MSRSAADTAPTPRSSASRSPSSATRSTARTPCSSSRNRYAYDLIAELRDGAQEFADNHTPPPTEKERGQLLRALASDAIRGSLERHFGVAPAFMNRHRVAAFRPEAQGGDTHTRFTSLRSQILNQSPEFRDC
ncbi:SCO5389 family protein [Streptomyces sp. NPDC050564]|uniref:SCO5389 family protein n=1 Tax=Streptomyces sp. NPDC050564 TaxID=3365631 RepID=UPI0037B81997